MAIVTVPHFTHLSATYCYHCSAKYSPFDGFHNILISLLRNLLTVRIRSPSILDSRQIVTMNDLGI